MNKRMEEAGVYQRPAAGVEVAHWDLAKGEKPVSVAVVVLQNARTIRLKAALCLESRRSVQLDADERSHVNGAVRVHEEFEV